MKLIFAIVHDEDSQKVTDALSENGHSVTKLCSTGGFLKAGNTTLIIGTEDDAVDAVMEIIKTNSKSRKQRVKYTIPSGNFFVPSEKEVDVGGATIFITDVERFEKI